MKVINDVLGVFIGISGSRSIGTASVCGYQMMNIKKWR